MLRIAVVGSGPSGVYAAQTLVQQREVPGIRVDVFDRLPAPYGLVRYGVAPDHEKIKSLQGSLRTVLEDERIRFLGNVEVGGDALPTARLLELYHAVVYCVGAARDRMLGIPGEDLAGVHSATAFVSWYSGHPDAAAEAFGLPGVDAAIVVGAGNVAVDVTRILARGVPELAPTDMPQPALGALGASGVRAVHMVARRGPSQGKFTTKELRELGTLPGVDALADPAELALDPAYADPGAALPAVNRRNVEVLRGWAAAPASGGDRRIALRFFLRPVEVLGGPDGRVTGMRFERTAPDGLGGVTGTGVYEDVPAQLVLRSVGYQGVPLDGLPFDERRGTVPHAAGRVLREGRASVGEYVAGWIKRGPTGVIGTNRPCAKETASSLLQDAGALARRDRERDPLEALR
ncbi:FAD-dependent oxidoreductase, partial [Streptomyces sp. NPDC002812]